MAASNESNLKYLYTQLVANGIDKFLAAGITANAYRECAGNPNVLTIDGNYSRGNLSKTPANNHGIGGGYIGFYYHGRLVNLFNYAKSNGGILSKYSGKSLQQINTEIEQWMMKTNGGSIPASAFYDGGRHMRGGPYYNSFIVSPDAQVKYIASIIKSEFPEVMHSFTGDEAMHKAHNWFFKTVEKGAGTAESSWARYGEKTKKLINDPAISAQLTNTTLADDSTSSGGYGDGFGETWSGNVYSGSYELDLANATTNNLLNLGGSSFLPNSSTDEGKIIKRVYTYRPKNSKMVELIPMQLDYSAFVDSTTSKV